MRRFAWLVGCVALLFVGAAAQAQIAADDLGKNWDLRAGIFIPSSGASRDAQGDVWFTAGAERALNYQERYRITFSGDYYGSGNLYLIPLSINVRAETNRLRYGAGFGVGMGSGLDGWAIGYSYNLMVGVNLTQTDNPITLDLRWLGTNVAGLDGWALTLGKTF